MNLFLPEIGTKLELTTDWTFVLYSEYRNSKMFDAIGKPMGSRWGGYGNQNAAKNYIVTLPAGIILSVDRIYIRKGVSDYSSVTFTIPKVLNKKSPYAGVRFWTKLSDANKIDFELKGCNEATLDLIKGIDEKTKTVLDSIDQSKFMKILLGGKTINTVRPQEAPSHFICSVHGTIQKFYAERKVTSEEYKKNLEKVLIPFIRAHKIASLPIESDEIDIKPTE